MKKSKLKSLTIKFNDGNVLSFSYSLRQEKAKTHGFYIKDGVVSCFSKNKNEPEKHFFHPLSTINSIVVSVQ